VTTVAHHFFQSAPEQGLVSAEQLALAEMVGMTWVDLGTTGVSQEALARLPRSLVMSRTVLPFALEDGVLYVAVMDPLALDVLDDLAQMAGLPVKIALAPASELRRAIARCGTGSPDLAESLETMPALTPDSRVVDEEAGPASGGDAPVVKLVHRLIAEAARRRASDIHLEPLANRFRVRYRIDGVLLEVDAPPKRLQLAVISRLKIMANISIAEKRVPQDGRIPFDAGGRVLDLRVSSLPTAHGESIVMRVLEPARTQVGLPELGFLPDHQAEFERSIASSDGIMLVTGPTGSGKTTTLYAALHHLNQADRKIITVEDPVEYQITGINQVPVNSTTGMTFAAALRAMLRQSPNVVMIGEIRDLETADIALNASLTGHMVFSTLHTNDAPSAVTRLIDLGAKPFLVAAALRSVLAQRLVRRICPACKRGYAPGSRELHALGVRPDELRGADFAHGTGCAACHGTGYHGRLGIFELLPVTDDTRTLIYDKVTAGRLRARARQDGMRTMREDGIRKVLAGLTTIEEVVGVTVGDPL
jgi:type IV pilus assembly protein PilB